MNTPNHSRSQSYYGTSGYHQVSAMGFAREKAKSAPSPGASRMASQSSFASIQNPLDRRNQRRKLASTNEPVQRHTVSNFALLAITVNFVIGVGVLDLPHAFQDAGMILSSVIMALALGLSYLTVYWLFDSQARAVQQTYVRSQAAGFSTEKLSANPSHSDMESKPIVNAESSGGVVTEIIDLPNPLNCWVTLEVVELVDLFLGRTWRAVVIVVLYLFQTSTLWAYAAVFSQSLATIVRPFLAMALHDEPETLQATVGNGTNSTLGAVVTCNQRVFVDPACVGLYMSFLVVFGVSETVMIIVGIKETACVQTFLAIYRFAAIFLMVVIAAVGLALGTGLSGEAFVPAPAYAEATGLGVALPAISFSLLLQMAVPAVMEPMREREKAPRHFILSLGICAGIYVLIGIALSYYLGNQTEEPVTLNFATFTGFMTPEDYLHAGLGIKALVVISQYVILFFPLLDLFSAFALQGVVLCNNVLSLLPDRCLQTKHFCKIKAAVTIAMSGIPIVLAAISHQLGFIINVTGTLGLLLGITLPGILQFQSLRVSPSRTPYTPENKFLRVFFFSQATGVVVAILGLVLFIYSLVEVFELRYG